MKSYAKGRGWLFPLVGGPLDKIEYRLGWNREQTVEAALAELPEDLFRCVDGGVYVPRPSLYKAGKNKGQQKLAKADGQDVPAIEYVWQEASTDAAAA